MTDDLARLRVEQLREALTLLGVGESDELPSGRAGAGRALREVLAEPGFVRSHLAQAPAGVAEAFARLAREGPLSVEALLERGWWGRGLLPPPLDWLQRRALVVVDDASLVRATSAAVQGWSVQRLQVNDDDTADATGAPDQEGQDQSEDQDHQDQPDQGWEREPKQPHLRLVSPEDRTPEDAHAPEPVRVESAASIVIVQEPEQLDRAVAIPQAGLRMVAPTVAVSKLGPEALQAALRAGGIRLRADEEVSAQPSAPALPGASERAVTPWDIRSVLLRAVEERRQVHLVYYPSSRGGATTERTVDPWSFQDDLLRGWCHLRVSERTFALDRVGSATLLGSAIEHKPE